MCIRYTILVVIMYWNIYYTVLVTTEYSIFFLLNLFMNLFMNVQLGIGKTWMGQKVNGTSMSVRA